MDTFDRENICDVRYEFAVVAVATLLVIHAWVTINELFAKKAKKVHATFKNFYCRFS